MKKFKWKMSKVHVNKLRKSQHEMFKTIWQRRIIWTTEIYNPLKNKYENKFSFCDSFWSLHFSIQQKYFRTYIMKSEVWSHNNENEIRIHWDRILRNKFTVYGKWKNWWLWMSKNNTINENTHDTHTHTQHITIPFEDLSVFPA